MSSSLSGKRGLLAGIFIGLILGASFTLLLRPSPTEEMSALEENLEDYREAVMLLKGTIDEFEAEVVVIEEEKRVLNEALSEAQTQYQEVIASSEGEQGSLLAQLQESEDEISELMSQLEDVVPTISDLEAQIRLARELLSESTLVGGASPVDFLYVNVPLPREIDQVNYQQSVESWTLRFTNFIPLANSTVVDEWGNRYIHVYGVCPLNAEIQVNLDAVITRNMDMEPVVTSDEYPIPTEHLEAVDGRYLEAFTLYTSYPSYVSSDDPIIVTLAEELSDGCTTISEVVDETLSWISTNVVWGCPSCIMNYSVDPLWTLEKGMGNCVNFGYLYVSLFRAQGIPARMVTCVKGYEHSNPGYQTLVSTGTCHMQTEIYYPEVGWIRYDATYFDHPTHIPYGIQLYSEPRIYPGHCEESEFKYDWLTEEWTLVSVGEGKVKMSYLLILAPRS